MCREAIRGDTTGSSENDHGLTDIRSILESNNPFLNTF
jgi:hypothetical protein